MSVEISEYSDSDSNLSSKTVSMESSDESSRDSLNRLIGKATDVVESTDCKNVECVTSQGLKMGAEDPNSKLERRKSICCNPLTQCIWSILLIITSISGFIYTPLDLMMWEKLHMRPGMIPYVWWENPPDDTVRLRVYLFNVTNHERFLKGLDKKINMEEIGPIVYFEKLQHYDVIFNENSTLTYTAKRTAVYLPDESTVDLNATIVIPNMALLGLASYLHNAPYVVRAGFRFLATSHGSNFFLKKTVYEYLWDYREPILQTSRNLAPGLVPVTNMGALARIYADFTDVVTVKIGTKWGHKQFFHIEKFRGQPQLPGYDPDVCPDRIYGSTEGVMYSQYLTEDDVLLYWRKTVCKLMPLYFDSKVVVDNVPAYRYNLSENVFDRVTNGTDCYDTTPSLPKGLSDASKCFYGFPVVASYPHFYTGDPPKDTYVTGLTPNKNKHASYAVVEPNLGTPFRSVARMQSNLRTHDLSGFSYEYSKFSNLVLPLFWLEYNQEGLPEYIRGTVYFMVVILPPLSIAVLTLVLMYGCYLLSKYIFAYWKYESLFTLLYLRKKKMNTLAKNKVFLYETDKFVSQR